MNNGVYGRYKSIPRVGYEHPIPVSERRKVAGPLSLRHWAVCFYNTNVFPLERYTLISVALSQNFLCKKPS